MKLYDVVRLKQDVLDMPKDSTGTIIEWWAPGVWEVEFHKSKNPTAPPSLLTVREEEMELELEYEDTYAR